MRASWRGLLILVLLLAGFAIKGVLIAPSAAPARFEAGEFNAPRALGRLQRILGDQQPHPVDSDADDAVRSRLIAELTSIGLQPHVQDKMDCSAMPKTRFLSCSHVHNVIATVPSRAPGPQLLLNAHYDSTPTGPGAGDDGLGVATLLEVGSILKSSPPARPVTLLFNEGEEFGLNGAHAFANSAEAKAVNSLVNIDDRGVTGVPLMYETSDPNGAALRLYAGVTRHPYANSISTDFAKLVPNTTDVVFFKPRGWTLLNYGIIGNETRYHSPGDNLAALDRNSLAQMGAEVLAATRALVSDAKLGATGRTVFIDIAGRLLIRLPLVVAATALTFLLIAGFALGWSRSALGRPLLAAAAMTVVGVIAAWFLSWLLTLLRAGDFWRAYPLVSYLAVYSAVLLAMSALYARLGLEDRQRVRAASWLLILIAGSLLSIALPGATIFFLIAPAIALVGIALSPRGARLGSALVMAAAVVQFIMFAELLAEIEALLIDGPLWAVAPLAALATLPILIEADAARMRPSVLLAALATLGFSAAALGVPRASAERPLGMSIDYYHDAGGNKAYWAIATKQAPLPSNFAGKWRKGELAYNGRPRWIAAAPLLQTPMPLAKVLASEPVGPGRQIRIVLSTSGANTILIRFPADAKVRALGLPGAALPISAEGDPQRALLRCTGRSCDGLQIDVLLGDRKPITAELFATQFGLPPEGRRFEAARPANAQPQYAPDQTITRATTRL